MNMPLDYAQTEAYSANGSAPQIPHGGHECVIKKVEDIKGVSKKTGATYEYLEVSFDIHENGEFDGFYANRYREDAKKAQVGEKPKWKGIYKQSIYNGDGSCSKFFKGFITAVEDSNPGFKFMGDESTLANKRVGFVFRDEPFVNDNGKVIHTSRPCWACNVKDAKSQPIPAPKDIQENNGNTYAPAQTMPTRYNDDDIPF